MCARDWNWFIRPGDALRTSSVLLFIIHLFFCSVNPQKGRNRKTDELMNTELMKFCLPPKSPANERFPAPLSSARASASGKTKQITARPHPTQLFFPLFVEKSPLATALQTSLFTILPSAFNTDRHPHSPAPRSPLPAAACNASPPRSSAWRSAWSWRAAAS